MSFQSARSPCVKCGTLLHTGEGRVTISITVPEIDDLLACLESAIDAEVTWTPHAKDLRGRLQCARSLLA
jgi:hypothetical protein